MVELEPGFELANKSVDESQPQSVRVFEIDIGWKSAAIVADGERERVILFARREPDKNPSLARIAEAIFQRIGNELVDDQAQGDGFVDCQQDPVNLDGE